MFKKIIESVIFKEMNLSDENAQSTTLCKCSPNAYNFFQVVVSNKATKAYGPTAHRSASSGDHLTALIT